MPAATLRPLSHSPTNHLPCPSPVLAAPLHLKRTSVASTACHGHCYEPDSSAVVALGGHQTVQGAACDS